ncbi:MAG: 16S rRNA (uracil(1498)-N(3))-methyltransferase [Gammaproteobacteria bacterium]|nr:MAG: 16S rRNA (uracil(1498)-N(3))-methyltransferase [Gammaproteobacteria bacterium]RKZ94491.1 MAG: 16S rRNA (uracil(1498)-N(3))-methyltransferase [Gammaproteobacteria bacterium]RKZ97188.1 MAG: 16S rRNA (uracil(1498)-N(3))-methyltransferase [Gammaproteobacteria bacterium]RLA00498.1 MAG: 16S rRNA (uracil(1498)-N(3))-methyltransferase [Gammaproteobacteria bacterium]
MAIQRFYCPELNASSSNLFELPAAAHRHAVQVLRLKEGSLLRLFNGQGLEYEAVMDRITKRNSSVLLGEKWLTNNESPLEITLLQGISRGERMDYALQKAVELGVSRIIPIITERCNVKLSKGRADKRMVHWQGVMISACEQSGRNMLPELCNVMQLEEALADNNVGSCLVLDPLAETGFTTLEQQYNIVLLIGPEGGLSEQEIQQATTSGFKAVKFGPRILRTETATVAALAVIQTMWGDLGD